MLILAGSILTGCADGNDNEVLKESTGRPGDVIVVMNDEYWDGPAGNAIRQVLKAPFPMILQLEPMFEVRHKSPKDITALNYANRNIILVEIDPDVENRAGQKANRWAKPQMAYSFHAKDVASFLELWSTYSRSIESDMRTKDRERLIDYYQTIDDIAIGYDVREKMDIELTLHRDFKKIKMTSEVCSFIKERVQYLSGTAHEVKQGIVVYSYPYTGDSLMQAEQLAAKRNEVLGDLIKSKNGSPMTIETRLPATYLPVPFDSLYAIEGRGLWRMEDPIQGGTFISLSVIDEKKGRIITVDGYVYSPQFDKRPLLLEIEAFIYSLKI